MSYFYKENMLLEGKVNCFFNYIEQQNFERFNNKISIILLGSMSRGEATWKENNGVNALLSDIEFLTVYEDDFNDFKKYEEVLEMAKEQFFSEQNSDLFKIDNSYTKKSSLSKLEKKLLIYDANASGKTVVGNDYVNLLPKISIENINLKDIYEVLVHRCFSILYYGGLLLKNNKLDEYKYCIAKNSLDLMTVMLVENKKLVSGFKNRFEEINKLNIKQEYKDYFSYCLNIKLKETNNVNYSIENMKSIFIELVEALDKNFHSHFSNDLINLKSIIRRKMGILKRGIKFRRLRFSQRKHLHQLVDCIKEKSCFSEENIINNYVLNGYPEEKHDKRNGH